VKSLHHDHEVAIAAVPILDIILEDRLLKEIQPVRSMHPRLFNARDELGHELLQTDAHGQFDDVEQHPRSEPLISKRWINRYPEVRYMLQAIRGSPMKPDIGDYSRKVLCHGHKGKHPFIVQSLEPLTHYYGIAYVLSQKPPLVLRNVREKICEQLFILAREWSNENGQPILAHDLFRVMFQHGNTPCRDSQL
jgi:hypothetical protein